MGRPSSASANGTFFAGGTFWGVFTADNGKSITISAAGPAKQTSPPIIDEQAGTITFVTTVVGLPEKLAITSGATLSRDAGTATFVDVFEYTGDPENPVGDFISSETSGLPQTSMDSHGLTRKVLDRKPLHGLRVSTRDVERRGGIRTLDPPMTDNGFRNRAEKAICRDFWSRSPVCSPRFSGVRRQD
jgi:hypothetical protein